MTEDFIGRLHLIVLLGISAWLGYIGTPLAKITMLAILLYIGVVLSFILDTADPLCLFRKRLWTQKKFWRKNGNNKDPFVWSKEPLKDD